MARRTDRHEDAGEHVVVAVEVSARSRQVEVTTMQRGSGKHVHYHSLNQAPPDLRGEALALLRDGILNSGYASLAELEAALTSELVVPEQKPDEA